jgi:hypothetical protein
MVVLPGEKPKYLTCGPCAAKFRREKNAVIEFVDEFRKPTEVCEC